ncbi:aspartyl-phosphate phosphatase Spo0E family protein [Clostridium luticellarii]|jgi:hypothetical protein|uniref:aspartyl-phosphate phosphatase Spo0E family protein n=1 Tax=Clostridium luticellarii TaxID=1691940 RepID=UPI00235351F8|nr:aspartyl-phosphate phosphatase Spo0E family protein [Clostridium luticellarii]
MEQIEQLRERLNSMVGRGGTLYSGEILEISQQLDRLIYLHYRNVNCCESSSNANLIFNI